MASQEGSSYQNPIRFYAQNNGAAMVSWEKGKRAFDNQKPGIFVDDLITGATYMCTKYKTSNNEPVWVMINAATLQPTQVYKILVNMGKSGDEPSTVSIDGKKTKYTSSVIKQRLPENKQYNLKTYGSFIFIRLSDSDIARITGEPISNAPVTPTVDIDTGSKPLATEVTNSQRRIAEMYEYMRTDSNGRSGFGATLPSESDETQYMRTDASGRSGFGATTPAKLRTSADYIPNPRGGIELPSEIVPTSPKPDGSTNPSGSAGGKKTNPSRRTPSGKNPYPGNSTTVVKLLPDKILYSGAPFSASSPYMQQVITDFDRRNMSRQRIIRTHVFDIVPNSFEFSQLSSTWNEVERSGNYPMVDWSKYNLTKCTFRFLIAGERTDTVSLTNSLSQSTVVNDGLDVSVEKQIENLRAMAGGPNPITLHNLNMLTNTSFRFPYIDNSRNLQWVIADMSLTATRLTEKGRAISAAEVSITLNEYPVIARDIIYLPPLRPDNPVPKQCKPKPCKKQNPREDDLWYESTYTWKVEETVYIPEKVE